MRGNSASYNLKTKKMKKEMVISLSLVAVFSEHCYVQNSWMEIQDDSHKLWDQITSQLKKIGVEIYFNHFVLQCEDVNNNPIYLGYNDSKVSFGFSIGKLKDSKEIVIESYQELTLSL